MAKQWKLDEVATLHEIEKILGLVDNMLYVWKTRHEAEFPEPVKTIGRAAVYSISEVEAFVEERRKRSKK